MSLESEQRQAVADLTDLCRGDLRDLWRSLDGLPADQVRDALMDVLPALGGEYGDAAATLAADYFEAAREAAGASGSFSAVLDEPPNGARWRALARWGVDPLFAEVPDHQAALARVAGGLQRSVADQHRLTIVKSSIADPQAKGWRRVGVGETCGFCRMLLDRGHVYTEATATFRSHDHCNCVASPSWDDRVVKVSREPYRQSLKRRSEATRKADNARARRFIADTFGA